MKTHLEDHEFTAAVEGLDLAPGAAEHLASCISCRQQVDVLEGAIAERRGEMEVGAPDWDRQREEILSRLGSAPPENAVASRRRWQPLLAAAAVVVVAVGLGSLWRPSGAPETVLTPEIAIEEILAEVDAVLADDSLPGFESIDPGVDDPESLFENGAS